MARLATRLGHHFEAIVFLTTALADEPDRADLRAELRHLEERIPEPDDGARTLLDRLPTTYPARDASGTDPEHRRSVL